MLLADVDEAPDELEVAVEEFEAAVEEFEAVVGELDAVEALPFDVVEAVDTVPDEVPLVEPLNPEALVPVLVDAALVCEPELVAVEVAPGVPDELLPELPPPEQPATHRQRPSHFTCVRIVPSRPPASRPRMTSSFDAFAKVNGAGARSDFAGRLAFTVPRRPSRPPERSSGQAPPRARPRTPLAPPPTGLA